MKHFLTGILFCVLALGGFAQDEYVDSLRRELVVSKDDSAKIVIYKQFFDYYSLSDNYIAELYADTILLYAIKYDSDYWKAVGFRSKGVSKDKAGNYKEALDLYEKAESIAKKIDNDTVLYQVYNDIGNIYVENYNDFNLSKKYLDMAIERAIKTKDPERYAISLVNKANLYYAKEEYDTILMLFDSALNITSDINTKIVIYNNIAVLQYYTGSKEEAINTYSKVLTLLEKVTDRYMYASVLNSLSSIYIKENEYDKALVLMNEVDSICKTNTFDEVRLKLYENYYHLYDSISNYKMAYYYHTLYYSLSDSIYDNNINKKLNQLENKYQREKSKLELKIRDEEISHQKTLNAILFSIIAIVLIFIAVIAFLLVKKSRMNKMLAKLNADLKQRDEEISSNLDYAREIQLGCMSNSLTESNLQMFVLDRPKVVVGGDFYISQTKGDASYVVVGDCTGHGISGGFLSVLGIKSVYAAIEKYDTLPEMASFINNEFCEIVSSAENLKGESLCLSMIRICGNEVRFLGSKQKMWIVSGDGCDCSPVSQLACKPEVREYKSANAIMGSAVDEEFTEEIINVRSGDVVFLSSDGYPDQFGAEGKLKYSRFRNLLLECSQMEPNDAKSFLSEKLDLWRGDLEQTDDVMVVGMYF